MDRRTHPTEFDTDKGDVIIDAHDGDEIARKEEGAPMSFDPPTNSSFNSVGTATMQLPNHPKQRRVVHGGVERIRRKDPRKLGGEPSASLAEAVQVKDVSRDERVEAMVQEAIASRVEHDAIHVTRTVDFDPDDKIALALSANVAMGDSPCCILSDDVNGDGDMRPGKSGRYRRYGIAFGVVLILLVAVVVGVTVGLGGSGGGGDPAPAVVDPTSPPNNVPTVNSTEPSTEPKPGRRPTVSPTEIPWSAFTTTKELEAAVDVYLINNSNLTDVSIRYGHPIGTWDVSRITDFCALFSINRNGDVLDFNENLTGWDMSRATNLANMFDGANSFNGDVSTWDTSSCSNMATMFQMAWRFHGNVSAWDVSKVTDMSFMFNVASSFSSDISSWDVGNVESMQNMFNENAEFNADLSKWDVSSVTDMSRMFKEASRFDSDLSNWNTSSLMSMHATFQLAVHFTGGVEKWDVSKCRDMDQSFNGAAEFRGDLSDWNVSSVTSMRAMFQDTPLFNGNISSWNVASVTDLARMFDGASDFNQNLCPWTDLLPASVDASGMFSGSGCPTQADPTLSGNGTAFCYNCGGGSSGGNGTNTSSRASLRWLSGQ